MFATPPVTVLSRPGDTSGASAPGGTQRLGAAAAPCATVVLGMLGMLGLLGATTTLGALASVSYEIGTDVRLVTPGGCA